MTTIEKNGDDSCSRRKIGI